jgi:hypothetical protein
VLDVSIVKFSRSSLFVAVDITIDQLSSPSSTILTCRCTTQRNLVSATIVSFSLVGSLVMVALRQVEAYTRCAYAKTGTGQLGEKRSD